MIQNDKGELKKSPDSETFPQKQDHLHVVQPGESLTTIAQVYYGQDHASHWITLYNYNRDLIGENPDLIQSGTELLIPDISEFL